MKKIKKTSSYKTPDEKPTLLEETQAMYAPVKKQMSVKDISYNDFKRVSDKVPFTQAEWADILHVSERTLQRYAKDNHAFAPINAERLVLVDKVLQEGKVAFGKYENFYNWIKREPYMLEGNLSVKSLTTYEGIQNVLTQLGRIKYGLTS
jgi:putative toxin-antitoxin system antitoxin component (TIGR02293 family)